MQITALLKLIVAAGAIGTTAFISSCSLEGQAQNTIVPSQNDRFSSKVSEHTFKILMGEFYFKQHKYAMAAEYFLDVAMDSNDPAISERATKTAVFAGDVDKALNAARRWQSLDKDSSKASQYIALLLLHKKHYSQAADELHKLEQKIDEENERARALQPTSKRIRPNEKGWYIIVEMLKRDSSPAKVFETYKVYVERYNASPEAYFTLAEFAMADRRYETVLSAAEKASQSDDRIIHRKAKLIYINALSELDRPEEAANELSRLIEESADDRTKQIYARLLASLGKGEQAVQVLSSVYHSNANNISALRDMIALYLDQGRLDEAEVSIAKLLKKDNQKATAHYFYGRVFEARDQIDKAIEHYYLSLGTRAFYMDVRGRIVELLAKADRIDEALVLLHAEQKKSVDKRDLVDLYQMESALLERSGKLREALSVIKKASDLLPTYSGELQYSSALLYERTGDFESAERILKEVVENDPNNSAALNALGYMLLENTERYSEAQQFIERAYKLRPDDPAIIDSLGWAFYRQGNYDQAEDYLRMAYRGLKDPEVAGHLIEVLTKKGDVKAAKVILHEMIKQHPNDKILKKVKDRIIGMHEEQGALTN